MTSKLDIWLESLPLECNYAIQIGKINFQTKELEWEWERYAEAYDFAMDLTTVLYRVRTYSGLYSVRAVKFCRRTFDDKVLIHEIVEVRI